ncbi:hypothetical protein QYF68_26675 [Mycolicibacterium austroafricanum]|uniref:Uncharacterized protein n=1 Tax=Mycolicibacterium austroafricanum TaxID=39687 RepID=A0ABT8HKT8_MYCAO|nr:hypothetical protein [Mycolicibacterium austroafricanum]MDN4521379.1 hypothetical protein [Mycolicibacterium austroafricanum]
MKRCKFCGRVGLRMLELRTPLCGLPDGYACHDRQACAKRAATVGKWIGMRVLRRRDLDGTRWTIRKLATSGSPLYMLTCEYRQHRGSTSHFSIEEAKAHRDDLVRSWEARSMREYVGGAR